jgi:hypothetical protein
MSNNVSFVGWADVTGDASRGAICRVLDGDEVLFSCVVRVSRSLMKQERLTAADVDDVLATRAERLVAGRCEHEPEWAEQHRGDHQVVWTLGTNQSLLWRET